MKAHIERNNVQLELIRYRKHANVVHVFFCEATGSITPSHYKSSTFRNTTNIPVSVGLHLIQQRWSGNPELARIIHYI